MAKLPAPQVDDRSQSLVGGCPRQVPSSGLTHSPGSGTTTPAASSPSDRGSSRGPSLEQGFNPAALERRLLRAASDDDIVLVQALIAGGGISGKTLEQALACAADHNAWKAMGYLIKEGGVEVNTCCDATGTALHHAILSSAAEALQVLTDAGSCPSIVNERGLQPWAMFAEAEGALTRPNANDDRRPIVREMMEAYEKRYALCKLRYVAWGLSELRSRGLPKNARFQARVESGQPLPRLTVRKAEESDPDVLVAVIRELVVGVGEEAFDVLLCLLDVVVPLPSPLTMEPLERHLVLREDESRRTSTESNEGRLQVQLNGGQEGEGKEEGREGEGGTALHDEFALEGVQEAPPSETPREAVPMPQTPTEVVRTEERAEEGREGAGETPSKVSIGVQTPTRWPEEGEQEEEEVERRGGAAVHVGLALAAEPVEIEPGEIVEAVGGEGRVEGRGEEEEGAEVEASGVEGWEGRDDEEPLREEEKADGERAEEEKTEEEGGVAEGGEEEGAEGSLAGEEEEKFEHERTPLLVTWGDGSGEAQLGCMAALKKEGQQDREKGCTCALSEGWEGLLALLGFK